MAITFIPSVTTALAAAGTDLLTVGAGETANLAALILTNRHTSAVTVAVYNVASGGSPGVSNLMYAALSIGASSSIVLPLYSLSLTAGRKLHLVPSVDAVINATLSGSIST